MKRFFDPDLLFRAYRDPLSWLTLAVDLLPIIAVLTLGWKATPLVALYWLENLIIGGFTILRMFGSVAGNVGYLLFLLFVVPFFTFHYGMFCFVHGIFIRALSGAEGTGFDSPVGLVRWAAGSGDKMLWFIAAIIAVNAVIYVVDFLLGGEYRKTDPMSEMTAPYGRIVTLHVAIIFGAMLAFGLGQPLLGVLVLIFLRVAFGVILNMRRRRRLDGGLGVKRDPAAAAG